MVKRLFRRKFLGHILEEIDIEQHRLNRSLNAFDLTIMGIGAIIGVGIFVLTGAAAAKYAGPGVILSFVISGAACAFAGLCYAELASSIPVAGSAYNYAYSTMGEMVAWIIGWDLILEYIVACIAVAIGWSGYFVNIMAAIGMKIPAWCSAAPGTVPGAIINLPAMLIVFFLTIILVIGIKESARFTGVMVFIKVVTVLVFIMVGISHVNPPTGIPSCPSA